MVREFGGGVVRPVLVGGVLVTTMAFACASPASADWLGGERPVTTAAGSQQWPQLSGSRLVYTEEGADGGLDIRVRNLATGTDRAVTTDHSATGRAAISGTRVVWTADTDARVWLADLATGERRRVSDEVGDGPSISGDRVCYTSLGRVHVHNVRSGADQVVSPDAVGASNCDISGDIVVWQDARFGSSDIFSYDLGSRTETRLTSDPAAQSMPRVDGQIVIWRDAGDGPDVTDIYARDLGTGVETLVAEVPGAQSFPDVSQGRIVWTGERVGSGAAAVYLYDLAGGVQTRVSGDDGWSGDPTISGRRIVYTKVTSGGHHLFQQTITPPVLTAVLAPEGGAVVGRLTGTDGLPAVGVSVHLESSADGRTWLDAGSAVTAGDAGYKIALPDPPAPTWVRVRFDGASNLAPVVSVPVRVGVR